MSPRRAWLGRPDRALLLVGPALVALIGAGQSLHDGSVLRIGSDTRMAEWVGLQAVAVGLYWLAVRRVLRRPHAASSFPLVIAVALAMRAIPLASPMFLSSDMFRYVWDGRVQLHGINPYVYLPADPALAPLRDETIYPHVNRKLYARTIYPPMAELVFRAVAWIGQAPWVMRAAMIGFEAIAVAALALLLGRLGVPRERVLIYAWNPLAVWEFAGNGHVDALAIGCIGLALLATSAAVSAAVPAAVSAANSASGRARARARAAVGIALAAAALVKFLPAVIAPALWRPRAPGRDWCLPAASLLTVLCLYAWYADAGRFLLGYLPGYAHEEGFETGRGFWLLAGLAKLGTLPAWAEPAYLAAILLGLAALAWHAAFAWPRRADPVRAAAGAGRLITFTMLGIGAHYPWYFPWACLPAVVAPQRAAIFVGSAALLFYLNPLHERFWWPSLVYAPTLALMVLDARKPLSLPGFATIAHAGGGGMAAPAPIGEH